MTVAAAVAATLGGTAHADPRREVPDYDGRGNPESDTDRWALWIPRIVMSPLYLVNEYVLRRPLGAIVGRAERDRWSDSASQFFGGSSDDDDDVHSTVFPTVAYDLGLRPSVGLGYERDGLFARGNAIAVQGATWGLRWIDASAIDRYTIDPADRVQLRAGFERARDDLFFGVGPDVTSRTRSRYGVERGDVELAYRRRLTGIAWLEAGSGLRRTGFLTGDCCDDPSLDLRIARGELMAPPGYNVPYTAAFARVELGLDTRRPRPEPGGGGYLRLRAAPSVDTAGGRSWIGYGGVVGGALDLTGTRRMLRLQLTVDLVDGMTGGAVPFTEYPVLDGERMPGFVTGWLRGTSTAAAQLGYTWPVWLWLDARARFTVGNAFGDHLAGLAPGELRMSGDLGVTTDEVGGPGFELLFGVGTETFDQGAHITSVRVTLGVTRSL